jgi:hypothetical protein
MNSLNDAGLEPFSSAQDTARFLCISRRHLLVMARRGMPGAYSLGTGSTRKLWVFRLSEVSQGIVGDNHSKPTFRRDRMASAVPAE